MALTRNQKIGIGVGVGVGLLALAGTANASDVIPGIIVDPIDPQKPTDPIPGIIVDPIDFVPDEPPPPPPPPGVCNYSGCGKPFDDTHKSPAFYMQRLQILGYPINPAGSILSAAAMTIIREFQDDYNKVKNGSGLAGPAALKLPSAPKKLAAIKNSPQLARDGLLGNNSIASIERAHELVNAIGLDWNACVNLS